MTQQLLEHEFVDSSSPDNQPNQVDTQPVDVDRDVLEDSIRRELSYLIDGLNTINSNNVDLDKLIALDNLKKIDVDEIKRIALQIREMEHHLLTNSDSRPTEWNEDIDQDKYEIRKIVSLIREMKHLLTNTDSRLTDWNMVDRRFNPDQYSSPESVQTLGDNVTNIFLEILSKLTRPDVKSVDELQETYKKIFNNKDGTSEYTLYGDPKELLGYAQFALETLLSVVLHYNGYAQFANLSATFSLASVLAERTIEEDTLEQTEESKPKNKIKKHIPIVTKFAKAITQIVIAYQMLTTPTQHQVPLPVPMHTNFPIPSIREDFNIFEREHTGVVLPGGVPYETPKGPGEILNEELRLQRENVMTEFNPQSLELAEGWGVIPTGTYFGGTHLNDVRFFNGIHDGVHEFTELSGPNENESIVFQIRVWDNNLLPIFFSSYDDPSRSYRLVGVVDEEGNKVETRINHINFSVELSRHFEGNATGQYVEETHIRPVSRAPIGAHLDKSFRWELDPYVYVPAVKRLEQFIIEQNPGVKGLEFSQFNIEAAGGFIPFMDKVALALANGPIYSGQGAVALSSAQNIDEYLHILQTQGGICENSQLALLIIGYYIANTYRDIEPTYTEEFNNLVPVGGFNFTVYDGQTRIDALNNHLRIFNLQSDELIEDPTSKEMSNDPATQAYLDKLAEAHYRMQNEIDQMQQMVQTPENKESTDITLALLSLIALLGLSLDLLRSKAMSTEAIKEYNLLSDTPNTKPEDGLATRNKALLVNLSMFGNPALIRETSIDSVLNQHIVSDEYKEMIEKLSDPEKEYLRNFNRTVLEVIQSYTLNPQNIVQLIIRAAKTNGIRDKYSVNQIFETVREFIEIQTDQDNKKDEQPVHLEA